MRILRRIAERQPEMFQTCLAAGLKATSALHERIRSNYHAGSSASTAGMHPWPLETRSLPSHTGTQSFCFTWSHACIVHAAITLANMHGC